MYDARGDEVKPIEANTLNVGDHVLITALVERDVDAEEELGEPPNLLPAQWSSHLQLAEVFLIE